MGIDSIGRSHVTLQLTGNPARIFGADNVNHYLKVALIAVVAVIIAKRLPVVQTYL